MKQFPLLWIPLLPLAGAAFNLLVGRMLSRRTVHAVACGTVLGSMVVAMVAVLRELYPMWGQWSEGQPVPRLMQHVFDWITAGALDIGFDLVCDPLTAVMIITVTFVGFLIHVYSTGYMDHEPDYARYFGYLNLFTGAMLLLVLGDNLVVMFIGWEGVGLCSYLLIGFWFDKEGTQRFGIANAQAGKKAFIVNRIGDFAFIVGMFILFSATGTLQFDQLAQHTGELVQAYKPFGFGPYTVAGVAALLLFIGATGKSAQIPLYVWLPDAMAGPTPVSALIHAATMVTAGVYMVARLNVLYMLTPDVMGLIALVGALTALFAATMGLAQRDIKKVLAYSTVSQLGYMFMAVGMGAFSAGIFHLFTHAFFKACLFLCAGAVIHALHGEQNAFRMGGLSSRLRITHATFLVSTLAISGIPPLAGFFSKDEILWKAISTGNPQWQMWGGTFPAVIYGLGLAGALCTAFYMFRVYALTFLGECRLSPEEQQKIHPPSVAMSMPLVVLAGGAAVLGVLGLPGLFGEHLNFFHAWLAPVVERGRELATAHTLVLEPNALAERHSVEGLLMGVSIVIAAAGGFAAYRLYNRGPSAWVERFTQRHGLLYDLVYHKYYIDELYSLVVVRPFKLVCWLSSKLIDFVIIDFLGVRVLGARVVDAFGQLARRAENGRVQHYVVGLLVGLAAIVYLASTPPTSLQVKPGRRVRIGESVVFDASPEVDLDQRKLSYRWDFDGDGEWDVPADPKKWSSTRVATHRFDKAGSYRVVLRVRDSSWRTERQTVVNLEVFDPDAQQPQQGGGH